MFVQADNELDFLYNVSELCAGQAHGRDATWQLAPVFSCLRYNENSINMMESFLSDLRVSIPKLCSHGERRALKAFVNRNDTITKPSYINRIDGAYFEYEGSQWDRLANNFVSEPLSGGLVFNVFHPNDLVNKKRPGYVPCLVSGSFLLHKNEVQLNAFFRSQSILEFGIFDLIFLRRFQSEFVDYIKALPKEAFPTRSRPKSLSPGSLNLHFARVVIPSRLARNKREYMKRSEVFYDWSSILVETIDEQFSLV